MRDRALHDHALHNYAIHSIVPPRRGNKMLENYFPQGLAEGQAFLGRKLQKKWLIKNIEQQCHTLLIAPRRFGKTSLVINVLKKLDIPNYELNFHLIVSAESVERKVIEAAQKIINQVVSSPESKLRTIQEFLSRAKKKWTIGFKDIVELELEPNNNTSIPDNIFTALQLLEDLLDKKQKKAVIFIDEIQELEKIEENFQIEGALRDFAQRAKCVTFIFSGSNRRLLVDMFNNREKPLYELSDQMTLDKIDSKVYSTYLHKISKKTWRKELTQPTIDKILELTDRHPRRVYNLCFYLWRLHEEGKNPPDTDDVEKAWQYLLENRLRNVRSSLSSLNNGQLKVLVYISLSQGKELSGQKTQRQLELAGSTITRTLKALEELDYVENINNQYKIIDPLVKDILSRYERGIIGSISL